MTVTLVNRSGRCLGLNLPHEDVCSCGQCFCATTPGRRPRRICLSLSLPAGHALAGLPEAYLAAREVRALVSRGELEVHRHQPKIPATSAPQPKRARRKRGDPR